MKIDKTTTTNQFQSSVTGHICSWEIYTDFRFRFWNQETKWYFGTKQQLNKPDLSQYRTSYFARKFFIVQFT